MEKFAEIMSRCKGGSLLKKEVYARYSAWLTIMHLEQMFSLTVDPAHIRQDRLNFRFYGTYLYGAMS